jgi:hypothetical protein
MELQQGGAMGVGRKKGRCAPGSFCSKGQRNGRHGQGARLEFLGAMGGADLRRGGRKGEQQQRRESTSAMGRAHL